MCFWSISEMGFFGGNCFYEMLSIADGEKSLTSVLLGWVASNRQHAVSKNKIMFSELQK